MHVDAFQLTAKIGGESSLLASARHHGREARGVIIAILNRQRESRYVSPSKLQVGVVASIRAVALMVIL